MTTTIRNGIAMRQEDAARADEMDRAQHPTCPTVTGAAKSAVRGIFNSLKNTTVATAGYALCSKAAETLPDLAEQIRNIGASAGDSFRIRYNQFWNNWELQYEPSLRYKLCSWFSTTVDNDVNCLFEEGERLADSSLKRGQQTHERMIRAYDNSTRKSIAAQLTLSNILAAVQKAGLQIGAVSLTDALLERIMGGSIPAIFARSVCTGGMLSAVCTATGVGAAPALAVYAGTRFAGSLASDLLAKRCN